MSAKPVSKVQFDIFNNIYKEPEQRKLLISFLEILWKLKVVLDFHGYRFEEIDYEL